MSGPEDQPAHAAPPSPESFRVPRTERPQRIVLMGTGPFAVPAFAAIVDAGHQVPLVVTRPPVQTNSRSGPPPTPVRDFAQARGIRCESPEDINTTIAQELLQSVAPELLVVCDYGQILSSATLSLAPRGGINLHGSLLPKYRGAAPVQWAVLNGDAMAGVSVIHMTPRLDGGPILATAAVPIAAEDTSGSLEVKLSNLGVDPVLHSIELLATWDGQSTIGQLQDRTLVSKAPRLNKAMGRIDWCRTAAQIDCHVRGMQPWPGAFTELELGNGKPPMRIAIKSVRLQSESLVDPSLESGTLCDDKQLWIVVGPPAQRAVLAIERLQPAGRNETSGAEFMRGYRLTRGTRFQ